MVAEFEIIPCVFSLFRAVRGPRPMDRVVGINMTNTLAMLCLAVCAFLLDESWLLDVCLIYGMISFLAVTVHGVAKSQIRLSD